MQQDITVSYEALTKDAALWDAVGDVLEAGHDELSGIRVHRGAFSFAATDLADLYRELHDRVLSLLATGATETRAGADALRAVRDDFERAEDVTQSELYGLWQPVL